MSIAIAVWSAVIKPGQTEVVPGADLRITNVALGDELADQSGRTSVKLLYSPVRAPKDDEDEEEEEEEEEEEVVSTVLCSLTPGKIEQATIDLTFEAQQVIRFEVVGKNTVYVTGNYVDQAPFDQPPFGDDDSEGDMDGYDLREVSSDVEIDAADELDLPSDDEPVSRTEEIIEETTISAKATKQDATKNLKRARDSDVSAVNGAAAGEEKPSKKAKKIAKEKAADGAAASAGAKTAEAPKKKKDEKKPKEKADVKEFPSGLKFQDATIGTGKLAKKGSTVSVRYIGKLEDGNTFDQNTKGKPFKFKLGAGDVIKGWDEGVAGMQVGGERKLIVPPKLAYGNRKQAGIPAGSTLIFDIKLLDV